MHPDLFKAQRLPADGHDSQVLETVWGYSGEWFGYVTEGPLFGWSINLGQWMRCNNPFFGSSGNVYYNAAGLHDVARQPFGNHAWVEVVTGQGAPLALRVIEVCHAKYDPNNVNNPTICKGNINRGTWLQGAVNSGALTNALKGQWDPVRECSQLIEMALKVEHSSLTLLLRDSH